jgi:DHA2 family multidrug resistance protein-like MFS transporter
MLARRFRPGLVAATGLVLSAAGILLLTALSAAGPGAGLGLLVTGQFVFFLGAAPMLVLGTDLVIGSAPPERSGSAAALSETVQEFGGAVGLAVFGSIAAAVYRTVLDVPEGVPAQAGEVARDTLGGAVAVAGGQPAEAADALLAAARAAFTDGLAVTAAVSTAVLLAAAVLAMTTLRHVPPSAPRPAEESPVRESAHAGE